MDLMDLEGIWMVEVQTTWGAAAAGGAGGLCLGALPWHSGTDWMDDFYITYIYIYRIILCNHHFVGSNLGSRSWAGQQLWGSSQANPPQQRSSAWPTPSKRRSSGTAAWETSRNEGRCGCTPKSSILVGFSIMFTIHFGVPLFSETSM